MRKTVTFTTVDRGSIEQGQSNWSPQRVLALALLLAAGLGVLPHSAAAQEAHFIGYDSVENRRILYEDFTDYDDARNWGIAAWNELGSVFITRVGFTAVSDLQFRDYTNTTDNAIGYWQPARVTYLPDQIYFNRHYMNMIDTFAKRGTAAHELGHAVGIEDHRASFRADQLMFYALNDQNLPQVHDIYDYRALWG